MAGKEAYKYFLVAEMNRAEAKYKKYLDKRLQFITRKLLMWAEGKRREALGLEPMDLSKDFFHPSTLFTFSTRFTLRAMRIGGQFVKVNYFHIPVTSHAPDKFSFDESLAWMLMVDRAAKLGEAIKMTTTARAEKILNEAIKEKQTFTQMAQNFRTMFGGTQNRAAMIAATESNWALNAYIQEYVKKVGILKVKIVPALGACERCIDAAKFIYDVYEVGEDGFGLLPIHNRCKCVLKPIIPRGFNVEISEYIKNYYTTRSREKLSSK